VKIIVAEDDRVSLRLLERELVRLGHEVVSCMNGQEAWRAFCEGQSAMVISDWMMPEMDGIELCQKIRSHAGAAKKYTYIILLTAKSTREDHQAAIAAGVDDFLSKPMEPVELAMRLRVAERIIRFGEQLESLRDIVPICMYCKKIHSAGDYWERLEAYFEKYKATDFSHGICPECYEKIVAEQAASARK
jgi:phosphoserine phosphatase RsbU/P